MCRRRSRTPMSRIRRQWTEAKERRARPRAFSYYRRLYRLAKAATAFRPTHVRAWSLRATFADLAAIQGGDDALALWRDAIDCARMLASNYRRKCPSMTTPMKYSSQERGTFKAAARGRYAAQKSTRGPAHFSAGANPTVSSRSSRHCCMDVATVLRQLLGTLGATNERATR